MFWNFWPVVVLKFDVPTPSHIYNGFTCISLFYHCLNTINSYLRNLISSGLQVFVEVSSIAFLICIRFQAYWKKYNWTKSKFIFSTMAAFVNENQIVIAERKYEQRFGNKRPSTNRSFYYRNQVHLNEWKSKVLS